MNEILVLPREFINGKGGFIAWDDAKELVEESSQFAAWVPREYAETSSRWVQPIPCAIFRDTRKRYCVFRQARQQRKDLSHRLSLVVGGHVEYCPGNASLTEIFAETVKREVCEESGMVLDFIPEPLGMVVDASSLMASKHVGFIYEIHVDHGVMMTLGNEFVINSKYNGLFLDVNDRTKIKGRFDPWSTILLSEYLKDTKFLPNSGRQAALLQFGVL